MKLPTALDQLIHKQSHVQELYCSLLLEPHRVGVSVWRVPAEKNKLEIVGSTWHNVEADGWPDRTKAVDAALTELSQSLSGATITKAILGLADAYLNADGDIENSVKKPIKTLCGELDLAPIGFVSLPMAIVHKLQFDEGVPPSVILIGIDNGMLNLSLYKVGKLLSQVQLHTESVVEELEHTLKEHKELEVLPSRILLYGDEKKLEDVRQSLLRHPWPTRVNFLHFPKIEILSQNIPLEAVSLAGASETATLITEPEAVPAEKPEAGSEVTHVAQPVLTYEQNTEDEPYENQKVEVVEENNVVMVDPAEFGFSQDTPAPTRTAHKVSLPKMNLHLPKMSLPPVDLLSKGRLIALTAVILVLLIALAGIGYWVLPHAVVTAIQIPFTSEDEVSLNIDTTAGAANLDAKIIPGKKLAVPLAGEKTIPVTGKKTVGTQAKGGVTISNKSLSAKTFTKGTILVSGALKFTLDSTVTVASASSSFDGTVYGKQTAALTASAIGTPSNLPAGSTFSFADFSSDVAIARNDQPFAGGTSKDITVVTRADYDTLTKALSDELTVKAKDDLKKSLSEGEKLVDDTVKASVSEKSFVEELDQEAKELHGKVTVTVSGISYKENDISELLKNSMSAKVPAGFVFAPEKTSIVIEKTQVKKDGSVAITAKIKGFALPNWDLTSIQKALAGKSLETAKQYLSTISGLGSAEFNFQWSLGKNKFPANPKNISIVTREQ